MPVSSYTRDGFARQTPALVTCVLVLGGMLATTVLAWVPLSPVYTEWVRFGEDHAWTARTVVRVIFVCAWLAHAVEAAVAWWLASDADPLYKRWWAVRTFLLGIFCLRYLLKLIGRRAASQHPSTRHLYDKTEKQQAEEEAAARRRKSRSS